jgi:hypothetical protein
LQDPNCDRNHNHYVQNRLDTGSHGDEVIDQPQRDADHDQRNDDVYQRHFFSLLRYRLQSAAQLALGSHLMELNDTASLKQADQNYHQRND